MQTNNLQPSLFPYTNMESIVILDKAFQDINGLMNSTTTSRSIDDKKVLCEKAFALIIENIKTNPLNSELRLKLYEVLHLFASGTLYNQGPNGFKDCAKLLRLSLLLQCNDLGLTEHVFCIEKHSTISELLNAIPDLTDPNQYHIGDIYDSTYVEAIGNAIDKHPEMRKVFCNTMIHLAFSHQNLPSMENRSRNEAFHTLLNDITLRVLPQETREDRNKYGDFLYNRCSFLVRVKHESPLSQESWKAQILSYDAIEEYFSINFGKNSAEYLGKLSQIENMRGILNTKLKNSQNDSLLSKMRSAVNIRLKLPESSNVEEDWNNRFLLNNARTGLIHALVREGSLSNIIEAFAHAKSLANFVIENAKEGKDLNDYNISYSQALASVVPQLMHADQSTILFIKEALKILKPV